MSNSCSWIKRSETIWDYSICDTKAVDIYMCPKCSGRIYTKSRFCPDCGEEIDDDVKEKEND